MAERRVHSHGADPSSRLCRQSHVATKGLGTFQSVVVKSLDEVVDADSQDALLCPVKTVSNYLTRTRTYRSASQKKLIISFCRGAIKDISKQTISNYIRDTGSVQGTISGRGNSENIESKTTFSETRCDVTRDFTYPFNGRGVEGGYLGFPNSFLESLCSVLFERRFN